MNFIGYINTPAYKNTRPVDNINVNTYTSKAAPAKYYRETSACCNNQTTQIFTNVECCVKPSYTANTVLSSDYYTTHSQYIKARCKSFEQNYTNLSFNPNNNSAKPNCVNATCNSTIYKRNNNTFATQGAVSSSARLLQQKYNTIQKSSNFNPRQSNYSGDNTHNQQPVISSICEPRRRMGDKLACD